MVKKQVVISAVLFLLIIIGISFSYSKAYFKKSIEVANTTLKVGTLQYAMTINGSTNNEVSIESHKYLFLDAIITSKNPIDSKFSLVYQTTPSNVSESSYEVKYFENQNAPYGVIQENETRRIRIRIYNNSNSAINITFQVKSSLTNNEVELLAGEKEIKKVVDTDYKEYVLNETDPVLSSNLVPITIEDNGTVKKANLKEEWYNYSSQRWANAVVLKSKTNYMDSEIIPASNIQSYFVWIPRYKYKLFNMGSYIDVSEVSNTAVQTIEVVFENKNITPVVGTKVGDYHSHPAFQAFDSNGFWVGKFESGYKGATSVGGAEQDNYNSSNLVIKPNVYSWRNISLGNAFKVSYDYLREDESHLMKNTEWGAVAYLQHSIYGSRKSVRINNNRSYMTGYAAVKEPTCGFNQDYGSSECNLIGTDSSVTRAYNTEVGYTASTTGNITGIYDMSGGAWEIVMGFNVSVISSGGASELLSFYSDFFTNSKWNKYYDKYENNTTIGTYFNKRILGDATGEMGPFKRYKETAIEKNRIKGSWYNDYGQMVTNEKPWLRRGGEVTNGIGSGIFNFRFEPGGEINSRSFRVVLTP